MDPEQLQEFTKIGKQRNSGKQKNKKSSLFFIRSFLWKTGFPSNRLRLPQDKLLTLSSNPKENSKTKKAPCFHKKLSGWKTGFEPATSGTTIQRSNQLSYNHHFNRMQM